MSSAFILEGHANGLGLIRALGKEGLDVYLLDENRYNIGRYSKYCDEFYKISEDLIENQDKFVRFLEDVKKKNDLERPIIFPTHDDQVYVLSKNKERLEENFYVAVPDWEVTKKCYNKVLTYNIAEDIGIPIPESYFMKDGTSLEEIDKKMEYPVIIKPGIMHKFYEKTGKKAIKVEDFQELKEKYEELSSVFNLENLIIQEIIPGGPENLYSYGCLFRDSKELAYLIKKSRRQIPMDFGTSTYLEKTDSPKVREMSQNILKEIGYNGMCEVEFKRDPRDGEFKFFEINARPWKWHSLLFASGMNLPYMLYRDLKGEKVENNSRPKDITWIDLYTDLYISLSEMVKGNLSLKDFVCSYKGNRTFSVFEKDDLMPFVMETILLPYLYMQRS